MRNLKIILSILFVLTVAFFVVRSCVYKKPVAKYPAERISKAPLKKAPKPAPAVRATMAIILDDWGNNFQYLKYAEEINRPITLAILPHLPYSRKIAAEAQKKGMGIMLHLPMQPKNAKAPLEPHTILTTMTDDEIRRCLSSALADIPGAEGVNNHQGSAATSDARVMRVVMEELKKRNLFFVDSNVIPATVGPATARKLGMRFTKRDVFIDNEMKTDAIRKQLERAKNIALRRGSVVVIGHDKEMTLQTIKEAVPELEKEGIQFVRVRDKLSG